MIKNLLSSESIYNSMSKSEKDVINFLKENFNSIPSMSISEICDQSFSSQGTINRTIKKLGFSGYKELKVMVKHYINNEKISYNIIEKITEDIKKINFEEVKNISEDIKKSDVVFIFAIGGSKIAAQYLQRQLMCIGKKPVIVNQVKNLNTYQNENIIVISNSGSPNRVVEFAKAVKKNNQLLVITQKNSSLSKLTNKSFTHNVYVDLLNDLEIEQQTILITMMSILINEIK